MDFLKFKQLVASEAQKLGINEYELYYQAAESISIGAFQKEINKFSSALDGGVCLRCLVNGKMGYASTEALDEQEASALLRRAADNAAVLESEEEEFLTEGGATYQTVSTNQQPLPGAESLKEKVLAGQEALYAADSRVKDGSTGQIFAEKMYLAIHNSKGLDLSYENTLVGYMAGAVVGDQGEMVNDYEMCVAPFEQIDVSEVANEAVKNAVSKLGAGVAPTANMSVVFAPSAMKQLLGTYSGIFSAENALKGLTLLKEKEGQKIAADCVTLVDDPFYPQSPMPMPFDAEGTPTRCKNIIQDGVLNTLLYNRKTAHAAGKENTGNAAKAGYDSKVSVRPFTMYLTPGKSTEAELLEKVGNGIYITDLGGLHAGANTISGDFSLQSSGFLIENGKKTVPVRSFTVAGNFFQLLNGIREIASEMEMKGATGSTAFLSPAVWVEGLSIAGK